MTTSQAWLVILTIIQHSAQISVKALLVKVHLTGVNSEFPPLALILSAQKYFRYICMGRNEHVYISLFTFVKQLRKV